MKKGVQDYWDEIKDQGRVIKCYILASDQNLISIVDRVCRELAVEYEFLPLDVNLLSKNILEENIDIVSRDGFVIIVLDVAGLGEKALELRNFWRVDEATIGIPFLYLVEETGYSREFEPLHGYEEIRRFSGESFEVEAGISVIVAREEFYRKRMRAKSTKED